MGYRSQVDSDLREIEKLRKLAEIGYINMDAYDTLDSIEGYVSKIHALVEEIERVAKRRAATLDKPEKVSTLQMFYE